MAEDIKIRKFFMKHAEKYVVSIASQKMRDITSF